MMKSDAGYSMLDSCLEDVVQRTLLETLVVAHEKDAKPG